MCQATNPSATGTLIADGIRAGFAAPDGGESVDPSAYYLRIALVFETAAPA